MENQRPFYVAELSGNHNGSIQKAKDLIFAAAEAKADAIKLQTYKPETMTLDMVEFSVSQNHELWGGKKLYDLYQEAMTPWEWHEDLFNLAKSLGMQVFSSPFDRSAVDYLEELECPIYKIASLEIGDLDLISYTASKLKPMIISTGASSLEEIGAAVKAASAVHDQLTLLLCTSAYPARAQDAHLRRLHTLSEEFHLNVGLSDHTLGIGVSVAAITLGATIIEKHFTLDRSSGGPDAAFSLEPEEFKLLVEEGNRAYESLGQSIWSTQESEAESRRLRRSLYITKPVVKGEVATRDNVKALRPNTGGPIKDLDNILGRKFNESFNPGHPAVIDCVE